MKVLLAKAITIWVLVCVPVMCTTSFDVENATKESYKAFLTMVLNQVRDPKLTFSNIPMMAAPLKPPKGPSYLLVELTAANGISITLALNKNDLYIVAYLDRYDKKYRAHFFPDAPSNAQKDLFKNVAHRKINYESNYRSIEGKAGSKRNVGLGIAKLKSFMGDVYEKEINDRDEAKFLLVAIQMVSEAVRFKYIENQVLLNFPKGFTPDYKITSIVNEWSKISKAIYNSKDGNIKPPLKLKNENNRDWSVSKVSEIVGDISLLSYQSGK